MKESIKLPAIKGIIGDWVYYQTTLPFSEIVSRVDNEHKIREYKTLDDYLQRSLSTRSKQIATYLLREDARFFNTVILGLFGTRPKWYTFGYSETVIKEYKLSKRMAETIGILELSGSEVLFSIDGQHRIEGIKQAIKKNPEKFELDELPIIIIGHTDTKEGKRRTRRLFSEINTKAVRVSGLDDLITNEDNPSAINARKLYAEFKLFNNDEFIQLSHKPNIDANAKEFTTILNLKEINSVLYAPFYKNKDFRPSDKELQNLYLISEKFWTETITKVSELSAVMVKHTKNVNDYRFKNKTSGGGSFLFRPIGLKTFAQAYTYACINDRLTEFWKKINLGNFKLNGSYWISIAWDDTKKVMIPRRDKLLKEYLFYLLGFEHDLTYLFDEYNAAFGISKKDEEKKKLPVPFK